MSRKSVRIDVEAYELLKSHKREGESFSKLILRLFPPVPSASPPEVPRARATKARRKS